MVEGLIATPPWPCSCSSSSPPLLELQRTRTASLLPLLPPLGGKGNHLGSSRRREVFLKTAAFSAMSVALALGFSSPVTLADSYGAPVTADSPDAVASPPPRPRKAVLPGLASTKAWLQFIGDGFSIRVPPTFEDIMEPEDYNAGLSLYGDKAKPQAFAARFASPDRSEVLSVVVRPSNQLKITFLEAKDITDLGTLKEAAKIFVPGGATLYSARTIKIKEDESLRSYYFYEFGIDDQHLALVAAVNSGKLFGYLFSISGNHSRSYCPTNQVGRRWCKTSFGCHILISFIGKIQLPFCQINTKF